MIIEVLFAEVCNLYGDPQNVEYLAQTLPDATIIHTSLDAEPYFVKNRPDMIIMGSMSDGMLPNVIDKLRRYISRIDDLIYDKVVFLATGNAFEAFCCNIENVTLETKIEGLHKCPFDVKINWFDRYNDKVLGKFNDITITGFRSQFSMLYGDNTKDGFVRVERGIGINRNSKIEGYRVNNFFGTHILGPILPLNPEFCEYLISLTGETAKAAFREEAMDAYVRRVKEFSDPKIKFE